MPKPYTLSAIDFTPWHVFKARRTWLYRPKGSKDSAKAESIIVLSDIVRA
jgi:hypothetical protein